MIGRAWHRILGNTLIAAIEAPGAEKPHTIYVGDSESDGECAKRGGRFVAVTTWRIGVDSHDLSASLCESEVWSLPMG